jgi:predicted TPR repeat methyltransferase
MPETLMQHAKKLHQDGRLLDAAQQYQCILQSQPNHVEALYGLGMAHAQTGRLTEGEQLLAEALKHSPRFAEGFRARGLMLMHLGRAEESLQCLDAALALNPKLDDARAARTEVLARLKAAAEHLESIDEALAVEPSDAARWNSRGCLLASTGRAEEALASFERALSMRPDFAEAVCNRATLLLEGRKPEAALAAFDALVALDPAHAFGWNNRGNALAQLQRFEEAIVSYDRALAIRPDFPEAKENRDFALFVLGRNARSPAKYVRGLFDEFSSHYDETMLLRLRYRAHLHVRMLADRVLPHGAPWRILDVGCGTGLAGAAFYDLSNGGCLDGIDISPRMLDAARARGIYCELILGDLEMVLSQPGQSYNLIVSSDTMTYFGDLAAVFSGITKRLEPGGFYLFASEGKNGEGWEQTEVHRFRHSESYLRKEASRAGLRCIEISDCILRREKNEPVMGYAVALRKTRPA